MISIIVTSFREPNLERCILSLVNQKTNHAYEIVVISPDRESENLCDKYDIRYFFDPGKGKSYALNLIFKEIKSEFLIFTDGDVFVSNNVVEEFMRNFEDFKVGVITGRPIPLDKRDSMLGYWSHLLFDAGAHLIRKKLSEEGKFLECSGYLFGFRNVLKKIPLDVAEDAYIPYWFYFRNYKIIYAESAKVFVKNPNNLKDWLLQRKRTSKAHETLEKYLDVKSVPRVKSFKNEVVKGTLAALSYPRNFREFNWTIGLFIARFYMWLNVFYDTKFKGKHYTDAWERSESTK
tara:strand:- start:824 stop:1696 length:873 start_codon:yes stop_codon:yes gene_type:complete